MKWTKDVPTKDGWYWAYEDWGPAFAIDFIKVEISPIFGVEILSCEHDKQTNFELWDGFYGPVDFPEPPDEWMDDKNG